MNRLFHSLNSQRPEHAQYNEAGHIAVRITLLASHIPLLLKTITLQALKECHMARQLLQLHRKSAKAEVDLLFEKAHM